jgi:hypothetical protein
MRADGAAVWCELCARPAIQRGAEVQAAPGSPEEFIEALRARFTVPVRVTGFVNRHLVFSELVKMSGGPADKEIAESQMEKLAEYLNDPDDVFMLEFHFLDDTEAPFLRMGTDKSDMVAPIEIPLDFLKGGSKK